jgi:SAM-dependent methyltransferase
MRRHSRRRPGDLVTTLHAVRAKTLAAMFPEGTPRYYALCKFATDPLYEAVYTSLAGTRAPVLDIGCGMGLNSVYLRARGLDVPITGIDHNAEKIAIAQGMAARHAPELTFYASDARDELPAHSGSVTILDILQYLDTDGQAALLRGAAARVGPGGRLVIRAGMDAPSWRFTLTRMGDRFANAVGWMDVPVVYPRPEVLDAVLTSCGLHGTIRPMWGRTPFNNWLAVYARPATAAPGDTIQR